MKALEVVLVAFQYIDERIERMESETTSRIDQLPIRTAEERKRRAVLKYESLVLKTRTQVLESKVEQLQADVANLENDLVEMKTDITLMKADVHGLKKIFYGEATDSDVDDPKGGDDPNGSDDPMGGDDPRGKTNDPKGKNGPKGGKDLKGGKYSDLEEVDEGDEKGGKVTEVSYSKLEARFLSMKWPRFPDDSEMDSNKADGDEAYNVNGGAEHDGDAGDMEGGAKLDGDAGDMESADESKDAKTPTVSSSSAPA